MKRVLGYLATGFLVVAMPVHAKNESASAIESTDTVSDPATAKSIWGFANVTVQYSGKPPKGHDQFMFFGRDEAGEIVMNGLGISPSGDPPSASSGAVAILRIRHDFPNKRKSPLVADADFVTEHGQSLFVMHPKKKRMWEVGRIDGQTLFRMVKPNGTAGDWQIFDDE